MIPEVALATGLEAVTADGFRLMVVWFAMMEAVWFTLMKAVWFTLRLAVAVWFETEGSGGASGAVRLVDCALHITCTGAPRATIS